MLTEHHYVVIIAGGAGTRLWPMSRTTLPKQFQKLAGEETLLQHMVKLSEQVVPIERILIMTVPDFAETVRGQIPHLPSDNILFEPARRDNGPAITLALLQLQQRDPEAIAALLWADHLIRNPEAFGEMLKGALMAAEAYPKQMVTVGAKPTSADPALGYIQMGKELTQFGSAAVFEVKKFVEKPDVETAQRFVASWEYLWNVGYKIMSVASFFTTLRTVQPDLVPVLEKLQNACQTHDHSAITTTYEELPKLSIEYLFTQYLTDILVVPADIGWSDVGTWNTLHEVMQKNSNLVTQGPVHTLNTKNSLIFAKDRLIATVGIEGLIVVDTGDTLLIMDKKAAGDIKQLTSELQDSNPELL